MQVSGAGCDLVEIGVDTSISVCHTEPILLNEGRVSEPTLLEVSLNKHTHPSNLSALLVKLRVCIRKAEDTLRNKQTNTSQGGVYVGLASASNVC